MRLDSGCTEGASGFWRNLMLQASAIDYGESLPELNEAFLSVWSSHYARISSISAIKGSFLEIGTGFGILAAGLGIISGRQSWTIEHPSRAYFYKPGYKDFLKTNGVRLIGGDLRDGLSFCSDTLPMVYFCDVIEHLSPWRVPGILKEILRVLQEGGSLVLSTPNLNRLSNLFRFISGYSVNPPIEIGRFGSTYGHIREFAPRELKRIMGSCGFDVVRVEYGLNPFFTAAAFGGDNIFSLRAERLINSLSALFFKFYPAIGDEIFVLARKRMNANPTG